MKPSNCRTRSNVVKILVTEASGIKIGDWLNWTVQIQRLKEGKQKFNLRLQLATRCRHTKFFILSITGPSLAI